MMRNLPPPNAKQHDLDRKFETLSIFSLPESPQTVIVALNRPKRRNAINTKMWKEIGEAFQQIGSIGDGCRCALLVGLGKGFCSGLDISDPDFGLMDTTSTEEGEDNTVNVDVARKYLAFRPKILEMQQCFTAVEECAVPVIAAIHGPCIGGGIDLTCCTDIRICSPSTIFGVREVRIGLAADVGTLQRLPKIIGHSSKVRELCYTGDDFDANLARSLGFVSSVSKSEEALFPMAMDICKKICRNSPVAVRGTKLSLNYSRDHSVRDGLEHVATYNAAALMTDDLVASFAAAAGDSDAFVDLLPHAKL